ncbi:O-antigen ligase family protein [Leptospira perolatii]|nr:O-antigen ligase family protein [Leptospira perolatii]
MEKISWWSFLGFLGTFPLSVSISQIFAVLSMLPILLLSLDSSSRNRLKPVLFLFWIPIGIYALVFLSSLFHFLEYKNFWKSFAKESEAGDFWMSLLLLVGYFHASKAENGKLLERFLWISFLILLITGFISVFLEFRLGKFISNGFQYLSGDRRQHPAGVVFNRWTYLPIGMMNTHLTFGGILSFYIPGLYLLVIKRMQKKEWSKTILVGTLFVLTCVLFLLNQSRSAWLGVGFVCLFLTLGLFREVRFSQSKSAWFKIILLLLAFSALLFAGKFLFERNWLLQRSIRQLTEVQTPENQRYWIYKNSIPIFQKTVLLGIGGGRFKEEHKIISDRMIGEDEQLWYELEITPRGHSHNDMLQFAITGGWFAGVLYALFFGILFSLAFRYDSRQDGFSLVGVCSLWIAGFFQCYLIDDEVALPFFAFCGILFARTPPLPSSKFQDFLSSIPRKVWAFLVISILINLIFWSVRLQTKPALAYSRQIKTFSPEYAKILENQILPFRSEREERQSKLSQKDLVPVEWASQPFQVEGCLTHRFGNPPRIRKDPFGFEIHVRVNSKNPPRMASITVIDRDAFDEDQRYFSHTQRDLQKREIFLKEGWNRFVWKDRKTQKVEESSGFPENLFFRDFRITYSGFDPQQPVELPILDFGDLCDVSNPP